jgi:hypothetical protein
LGVERKQARNAARRVALKMGLRLRDVGEASSLCPPGRSKAGRFAYAALPTAHFERNDVIIICESGALEEGVACLPFISITIGKKVEKNYGISTACAKILRRHFKFPTRLFYRIPSTCLGLKNSSERLLKPFASPQTLY